LSIYTGIVQFYRVKHLIRHGVAFFVVFVLNLPVVTAQESVYGPSAPPGAGFVRVFLAAPPSATATMDIGNVSFGPVTGGSVTPYRPVDEGLYLLRLPGRETELFARAGAYQTVLVTPEKIVVIADRSHDDPAKAQLVLYNSTAESAATLMTADAEQTVISAIPPMAGSAIVVNAVEVTFAVSLGGGSSPRVAPVSPFPLRRGASFSVFVFESGEVVETVVERATVELE